MESLAAENASNITQINKILQLMHFNNKSIVRRLSQPTPSLIYILNRERRCHAINDFLKKAHEKYTDIFQSKNHSSILNGRLIRHS
jgi:hypothetical protein